jgi:adenylate cyclase
LFPVIARNSSFTYKGKPVDGKQVSRELGARYIVEGSVRRSEDRVRIAAQLIDAATGHHLWAETYDRELRDMFDIQDEIAEAIARSVEPTLERSEWKRTLRQRPQELGLAMVHGEDVYNQWSESADQSLLQAEQAVQRAVALANDDPSVQYALAYVCRLTGQLDRAVEAYEQVLRLDPSIAHAFYHLGVTLAWTGKPDQAIENIETAMRLSPKDPWFHILLFGMSMAHSAAGRFEESIHWAQRSLQLNTGFLPTYLVLASSYATLGRLEEARTAVQELLRLNPAFSLSGFKAVTSAWAPDLAERSIDALRKAGLPEGTEA